MAAMSLTNRTNRSRRHEEKGKHTKNYDYKSLVKHLSGASSFRFDVSLPSRAVNPKAFCSPSCPSLFFVPFVAYGIASDAKNLESR
jgi:hypothetical protein